ncbi:NUDIX hydrolase [Sinomicrobium weinanense]|uniref:NUDIX hydrolase n=1 Tax=Sinomicrobium weinanense TaxID=2842200 RepID=A0A926JRV9_9FLAO|nr:NUDIX domain-containing protein [Sinomicrobium weinanense]MBC9796355.1 NUDIX hydrolase [Sinomicrobium weinanense]MBU3122443.1 NUDIX hydrolase [Sinomicrobium weinanense]
MDFNYNQEDKALVAVDCIIFGFDEEDLKLLLIKRAFEPEKGKWSLMGGFLKKNETLDVAANRVLSNLTGLNDVYMEQLYGFSKVDRDPVERTISVAYYALINIKDHNPKLLDEHSAQWFSISDVPDLIFDHSEMLSKALERLRRRTSTNPVGFELLPKKFTMRQLQKLYEVILGEELDKRNFQKKIKQMNVLVKLKEKDMTSSRKGSFLYEFDKKRYEEKVSDGFTFKM